MKVQNVLKILVLTLTLSLLQIFYMPLVSANTVILDQKTMLEHLKMFEKIAKSTGGNRAIGTEGGITSAHYIDNVIEHAEITLVGLPFETPQGERGQNMMVTVSGQLERDLIMLGAHYDSAKNSVGLNDNASGVAVLLALIQHYVKAENKPKNTLVFMFWDGNKANLAGSKALATELISSEMGHIHAYIDVDMVGTKQPVVNIAINPTKKQTKDTWLAKQLTDFFTAKSKVVKTDTMLFAQSDAASFAGKVPAISLSFMSEKSDASCQVQQCDALNQLDIGSMQLAAEAVQHVMLKLEQSTQ